MFAELSVSVLIPAKNEARNLEFLLDEVAAALSGERFEIIVVDDGSSDDTDVVLRAKKAAGLPVRHLRHDRSLGQSAAVRTGLLASNGAVIVTMDGDGQNDPVNIPRMLNVLAEAGPDAGVVNGKRLDRTDGYRKKLGSRVANAIRRRILNDDTDDSGCGLRVLRREIFLLLPFFDGWHRFVPALVVREGYRVVSVGITDRPRRFGRSNYGILGRGARGIVDLMGVWWLKRRFRGRANATEQ